MDDDEGRLPYDWDTVNIVEFDNAGKTTKTTPVDIWGTAMEDDGGIWIDLGDQEDGSGAGIHITDALLAKLGFVPQESR